MSSWGSQPHEAGVGCTMSQETLTSCCFFCNLKNEIALGAHPRFVFPALALGGVLDEPLAKQRCFYREVCVVRLLQHLPGLRSPAAPVVFGSQLFLMVWLGFFRLACSEELFPQHCPQFISCQAVFCVSELCRGVSAQRQRLCPHPHCPLEVTVTQFC